MADWTGARSKSATACRPNSPKVEPVAIQTPATEQSTAADIKAVLAKQIPDMTDGEVAARPLPTTAHAQTHREAPEGSAGSAGRECAGARDDLIERYAG